MNPGLGRVGRFRIGTVLRAGLVPVVLAVALLPAPVFASYVEESPSPSPSPSPTPTKTATPSPTPSANPTPSEPLPPAEDDYWEDINDPEYQPPSPTPEPQRGGGGPRPQRTDHVGPSQQQGGQIDIEAGSPQQQPEQQAQPTGPGRGTGLYSQDAYPPGTFDGGYGLFTPEITDEPVTATPDAGAAPAVPPSGSRSTEPIIRRLREADASLEQVARTLAPFPVAGLATYTASWRPSVEVPGIAHGQGAAIVAQEGTPVVASANGPVRRVSPDPAWGTTLELVGPDGTKYRYGRLLRVAPAIQDGMEVTRGQIIGFLGGTGTVPGGSYLWFQLADKADAIVAPHEYLDRWLKEALVTARVTTGLPAIDPADQVAAGLMSPEEAGIEIGPDGRPVNAQGELSALEALLSSLFFALLGWRGWRRMRHRLPKRVARPEPEPRGLDLGFPVPPPGVDATVDLASASAQSETASTSA